MAQTETQQVPCEHQEKLFYCKGYQALAKLGQKGGGVAIPADIQKSSGCGPVQLAVGGLALAREVGPERKEPQEVPSILNHSVKLH